jgi:hypothetical protein
MIQPTREPGKLTPTAQDTNGFCSVSDCPGQFKKIDCVDSGLLICINLLGLAVKCATRDNTADPTRKG